MLIRTSLTLPEEDVRLLDRLAALDDKNRSEMMRYLLAEMRPRLSQLVDVLEAAKANRDALLGEIGAASMAELEVLMPEVEKIDKQVLGALSRLEGAMTAARPLTDAELIEDAQLAWAQGADETRGFATFADYVAERFRLDPRPGNHGGHKSKGHPEKDSE